MPKKRQNKKSSAPEAIGIAMLSIGSALGIWHAFNSSPTVVSELGPTHQHVARNGMILSLLGIFALAGGTALVYEKKGYPAAIVTAGVGIAMYSWYNWILEVGSNKSVESTQIM